MRWVATSSSGCEEEPIGHAAPLEGTPSPALASHRGAMSVIDICTSVRADMTLTIMYTRPSLLLFCRVLILSCCVGGGASFLFLYEVRSMLRLRVP